MRFALDWSSAAKGGCRLRYFLDAEFNGFGGPLISLALAPENQEAAHFYEALPCAEPTPWVIENVLPALKTRPISRPEMIAKLASYLRDDEEPVIVGDWPEDIAHLALLMVTGPGWRLPSTTLRFELLDLPLFDSQAMSETPHNAYDDARALRAYVMDQERDWSAPAVDGVSGSL
jgi:hypothetical protein